MTISNEQLKNFQEIGQDAFLTGLIASKSGNLSVLNGDQFIITRTGSSLGRLTANALVEIDLLEPTENSLKLASSEVFLHQTIYQKTEALAVVHLHCPSVITLSLTEKEIIPLDSEGAYYYKKAPVIHAPFQLGSKNILNELAELLAENKLAVVSGHGVFAKGATLDEAFFWASSLEQSAKIIINDRLLARK
jgi:L-fuculose-phosphate aldolase